MLVPGSGYWYVDQGRGHFIKTLIVAMIVVGNIIASTTGFALPQGLCVVILLLVVLVPLFRDGQKAAVHQRCPTREESNSERQGLYLGGSTSVIIPLTAGCIIGI